MSELVVRERPTAQTTVAVLIGASEYPRKPVWSNPVLRASAHAFRDYVRSETGLALTDGQVLDLFDDGADSNSQLLRIGDFLTTTGKSARDLVLYYVGHGGFHHDEYYLGVRCTQHDREFLTTIESRKLAQVIRRDFRRKRVYVILDSCFAATAASDWQGNEIEAAVRKLAQPLPRQGTAFLAAASRYDVTRAPRAERYTVFTGAILEILLRGVDSTEPKISMYELYEEVRDLLQRRETDDEGRPELHLPSQAEGDISRIRLFPNAAHLRAEAQSVHVVAAARIGAGELAAARARDEVEARARDAEAVVARKPAAAQPAPSAPTPRSAIEDVSRGRARRWIVIGTATAGLATALVGYRMFSTNASDSYTRPVRRPVAVIDVANDQDVRDMANKLLDLLAAHAELALPGISDSAALVDRLPLEEERLLADALSKRYSAERNLAQRNFREAEIDAIEGQEMLLHVTPRAALTLYADLALVFGQSRLGENKDAEARDAIELASRLEPSRALPNHDDTVKVVRMFEAAKQVRSDDSSITVHGAGRVWMDDKEVGASPGTFRASLGRHVVWLTGMLRAPSGKEVVVTALRPGDVTIIDAPLTRAQKVVRIRMALSQAPDPAARASAMAVLSSLVGVHDAVLLSASGGKILWQTWRDRAPGFSAVQEVKADAPAEIVKQLLQP